MYLEQMSKTREHSVIGLAIDIYRFKSQTIDQLSWAHTEKRNLVPAREKVFNLFQNVSRSLYTMDPSGDPIPEA